MWRKLKNLFTLISGSARIWQFFAYGLPSLGGAITWWQATLEYTSWPLILFYSSGVFFFCAGSIAAIYFVVYSTAIFERLRYLGTEPLFVNPNPEKGIVGVYFKCKMMNMSKTRSIYIKLVRGNAYLQGRTNPEPEFKSEVTIVPPLSDFALTLAAVPEVDVAKEIKGRMEIEIAYGSSPDHLCYLLAYEIEPTLEIKELTSTGAQVLFTGPLKKYQHKRNPV